jgi:GMP synthase-like glutamine amidotransferase
LVKVQSAPTTLGQKVQLVQIIDGEQVPQSGSTFGALVFMSAPKGADEEVPWMAQEMALVRDACARCFPAAGHCFGSQMVGVPLGGAVHAHTQPEIDGTTSQQLTTIPPVSGGATAQTSNWRSCNVTRTG